MRALPPRSRALAAAVLLSLLTLPGPAEPGQAGNIYAPPPDVAAPPPDATTSPSGLASKVITPGTSTEVPGPTDVVTVHYNGWTTDGGLYDSSIARNKAAMFPLDRAVIPGWRECVQLMVVGEKRRCWIPEKLAYAGDRNRPRGMMVFDIELLDTRPTPVVPPADLKSPPADAQRTSTGLIYKVLRPGTGFSRPQGSDRVVVHYSGWTLNGKLFDSSVTRGEPTTLPLDDVIPGWREGLQLMTIGERMRFWIPQDLAYKGEPGGPRGALVFDVDLIEIQRR